MFRSKCVPQTICKCGGKKDWKVFLRVFAKRVFVMLTFLGNQGRRVEIFRDFDVVFLHFVRRDGVKKKM